MDRLTALIAIAHLKLRLQILQRHPEYLDNPMAYDIKRPMQLAGLKSRMQRAQKQEMRIADLGKRYDAVQDDIDELTKAHEDHAGHLEGYAADLKDTIERMIGDNGDPNDGDSHESDKIIHLGEVKP